MNFEFFVSPLLALLGAPLLLGVINRTKAFFGGRHGQRFLQPYYDLWKLLHKGAVYSNVSTWIFRASPAAGLAVTLTAITIVPLGKVPASFLFPGDLIFVIYLFGVMRFFTVLAAMDTGSAFEGMGASREVQFSALAEPAFLLALAVVARCTGSWSFTEMMPRMTLAVWQAHFPSLMLAAIGLFIVLLAENSRIPVDDPNTHLELTMIHEVMVLDHGGVDLAFIQYAAALKLWCLSAVIVGVLLPAGTGLLWLDLLSCLSGMLLVAVLVGIVESCMPRLSLLRVPQLLTGAAAMSIVGLLLM